MQIILLHPRFTQAKSVTLLPRHILLALIALTLVISCCTVLLYQLTQRYADAIHVPWLRNLIGVQQAAPVDTGVADRYVKENLSAMAMKVGEMQAQLMRLDALGERVQGLSGVKPEEFNFRELPGRGGADPAAMHRSMAQDLGMAEFKRSLDLLSNAVERREDYLNVVETALIRDRIRAKMLPTIQPVNVNYNSSTFGLRIDPFTGRRTFHEGIDFAAPSGTAIVAAAGGVVIAAEYHYQFGNMIEIDHGNDIVTRYAHASKLMVGLGDIVQRGQHIANIGTTGRSTGPHLHFEVLVKGVPQNPQKFLQAGAEQDGKRVAER